MNEAATDIFRELSWPELDRLLLESNSEFISHMDLTFSGLLRALATQAGTLMKADAIAVLQLWSGANILLAGRRLLRQGYYKEPLILVRSAFENFAYAAYLHDQPDDIERFMRGDVEAGHCITHLRKIFGQRFGRQYGLLSEIAHQKPWYLRSFTAQEPDGGMWYIVGGQFLPAHQPRFKFGDLLFGLMAFDYAWLTELILCRYDLLEERRFWRAVKREEHVRYEWAPTELEQGFKTKIEEELARAWTAI